MARVLIADDEESVRDAASFYVRREGHEPTVAKDGDEALQLFERKAFDLVLLDIMMPKRNGFEVCEAIRSANDDIPIIFLSAKGDIVDKSRGFGAGADDYITKPFDPQELVLRINSCLRRHGAKPAKQVDKIALGDLSIALHEHEVYVGETRIALTSKEFDLLAYMASYPGAVFTKEQLLHAVWGDDHVGDIGVVWVYVRKLREKIEVDPSHPRHILTEWGVGYRLV